MRKKCRLRRTYKFQMNEAEKIKSKEDKKSQIQIYKGAKIEIV